MKPLTVLELARLKNQVIAARANSPGGGVALATLVRFAGAVADADSETLQRFLARDPDAMEVTKTIKTKNEELQ